MKKTLLTSVIALLLLVGSVAAQTKTDTTSDTATASATPLKKDVVVAPEAPVLTKKQKIEVELRETAAKLKAVVGRTQVLIDLLTKNGKDTTDAQLFLDSAQSALDDATTAIDQFAGVVAPLKTEVKDDSTTTPTSKATVLKTKEVALFKDPLKKAQDSLKETKTSLIGSIGSLKELLIPKDTSN
jgi:hypothetical protein